MSAKRVFLLAAAILAAGGCQGSHRGYPNQAAPRARQATAATPDYAAIPLDDIPDYGQEEAAVIYRHHLDQLPAADFGVEFHHLLRADRLDGEPAAVPEEARVVLAEMLLARWAANDRAGVERLLRTDPSIPPGLRARFLASLLRE